MKDRADKIDPGAVQHARTETFLNSHPVCTLPFVKSTIDACSKPRAPRLVRHVGHKCLELDHVNRGVFFSLVLACSRSVPGRVITPARVCQWFDMNSNL